MPRPNIYIIMKDHMRNISLEISVHSVFHSLAGCGHSSATKDERQTASGRSITRHSGLLYTQAVISVRHREVEINTQTFLLISATSREEY